MHKLTQVSFTTSRAQAGNCEGCGLRRLCLPGRALQGTGSGAAAAGIRRIRVARGHRLARPEGAVCLCLVRSGCFRETEGPAGSGAVVNFCLPGEILGSGSAIAIDASSVCMIPWSTLYQLGWRTPATALECLRMMGASVHSARRLVTLVRDRDALGRLSGFLLDLAGRLQRRGLQDGEIRFAMNRGDIGQYLGLSSETVSRCFTELARRGLIDVRAKRVRILRQTGLRRLADLD